MNKKVYCRECDLADFNSIRHFVSDFEKNETRLDILVNNAGIMRCPKMTTKQGIEMQLGVNHMGHFLLTNLLLPTLKVRKTKSKTLHLMFFNFYNIDLVLFVYSAQPQVEL